MAVCCPPLDAEITPNLLPRHLDRLPFILLLPRPQLQVSSHTPNENIPRITHCKRANGAGGDMSVGILLGVQGSSNIFSTRPYSLSPKT